MISAILSLILGIVVACKEIRTSEMNSKCEKLDNATPIISSYYQ